MAGQFQRVRVPSLSLSFSPFYVLPAFSSRSLSFPLSILSLSLFLSFSISSSFSQLLFVFFFFRGHFFQRRTDHPVSLLYHYTWLWVILNRRTSFIERGVSSSHRFLIGHENLVDLPLLTLKRSGRKGSVIFLLYHMPGPKMKIEQHVYEAILHVLFSSEKKRYFYLYKITYIKNLFSSCYP